MPMTFGDHVKQFIEDFPGFETHTAESMIWQAAILVYSEHPWVFCLRESRIVTEPSYSDGTINLTENSTAVVLTGGPWSTTWAKRRIVAASFSEPYDITITGTGLTGTLGVPWVRPSDPAATYTIYRETYPLPADCNFGCEYIILDVNRARAIRMKDFGVFTNSRTRRNALTGDPGWVTRTALDPTGLAQITFGPDAPSLLEVYPLFYFAAPVKPASYSLPITPLFPSQFEDLITRRAKWLAAERKKKWKERNEFRAIYYDRYFEAVKVLDGGAEVERYIRGTYPDVIFDYRDDMEMSALRGTFPT